MGRNLVLLPALVLIMILAIEFDSMAEATRLTHAQWLGCGILRCYSLGVANGSTSLIAPESLYAKDVTLAIFAKNDLRKPTIAILARRARWNSKHNRWILQDVEVDRTQISGKVKIPTEIEFHPEDVALGPVAY